MTLLGLNLFQSLALAAVGVLLVITIVSLRRGRLRGYEAAFWIVLLGAGSVFVIDPTLTSTIANWLGIGRGADLIGYLAVITLLAGFWMTYVRLRRLRSEMTQIVRHLAILEAERDLGTPAGPPRSAPLDTDRSPAVPPSTAPRFVAEPPALPSGPHPTSDRP